ncbi:Ig-like domain-containing protein [Niabella sp. CC-SYL272]|uniref:Ig-like domain-containing protein n=1 Tax=Niabella agricola TaxID=2891571 RepID=UPI001F2D0549|nr:Ig-like domain-containing protein [Niabella agricola]MCF3109350.1 Ig-like domain-containing protein [Niabella agricola]
MRTNQPLDTVLKKVALCLLLLAIILSKGSVADAQITAAPFNLYQPVTSPTFSNLTVTSSQVPILGGDEFSNKGNVTNSTTTDVASWTAVLGGSAWLQVADNAATGGNVYPAGAYVGFVIGNSSLVKLTGNTVTVTTYLNGVATGDSYTAGDDLLAVSLLGSQKVKVGFVTGQAFNSVRITISNGLTIASTWNIYYAEILRPQAGPVPVCNTKTALVQSAYPAVVTTGSSGLASLNLGSSSIFSNVENIVNSNTSDAATMTSSVASVGTSAYVSVRNAGSQFPGGYFAGFDVASSNVLSLSLLSNFKIATYLNGTLQEEMSGNNLLLSAPLLAANERTTIGFVTNSSKPFNEVRYILEKTVNVDLGTLSIYNAVIKQFCAGSLVCNTPTRMNSVQQPVYIDAVNSGFSGAVCAACNLTGVDNVIDGNAGTAATMSLTAGVGTTGSLAVADAVTTYAAGTFAGFDIQTNTLLDVQVPNAIRIDLLNNGTVVQSTTGPALLAGVSTSLLTDPSRQIVGVIAAVPFDEVKISFNSLLNVDLGLIQIYDVIWQKNCEVPLPCNQTILLKAPDYGVVINGQHTGFSGAVNAAGSVQNPWNLVNNITSDYARIQTVANVAAQGSISVASGSNVFPGGVYAGFLVRENSSNPLALVNLLKIITINTYKRDAQGVSQLVESKSGSQLLGLTVLLNLLGNDYGVKNIGFITSQPFDEMQISIGGLANVGLTAASLDVFSATIDTRYVAPGTPGLSCPLFKTNPDINFTTVNKPVTGSVATNDKVPAGTTYTNAVAVNGADGVPNPSGGTLTLNADGSGNYTFVATALGSYSYDITVSNGTVTEVQNLTITVTDPAISTNLPIVNTDIASTNAGAPVTVNVLVNDHAGNPGGTLGTPEIFKQGSNGTATINGSQVVYTPAAGFVGKDTIVYKVCETPGTNLCGYAYVFVEVKPAAINTTSATDDFAVTNAGTAVTGNVKDNDIDPEGDPQTVATQGFTDDTYGTFTLGSDGAYTFTPKVGFSGTARFTYVISDNKGASATGTLYVYTKGSAADLTISSMALPAQVKGSKTVSVRISVSTVNSSPTDGTDVYVLIPKTANIMLDTYAPALTTMFGLPVQNADWSYVGMDASNVNYMFKLGGTNLKTVIAGSSTSSFGVTFTFNGGSNAGLENLITYIFENSGGESNSTNNNDSEAIQYNP